MCIKNLMQKNEQSKFWHDQLDQVDQLKKGNLVKLVRTLKMDSIIGLLIGLLEAGLALWFLIELISNTCF